MTPDRYKLLVLTPTFPYPPQSGGDIRVFHLVRRLSKFFEVHLFPLDVGDSELLLAETGAAAVHHFERVTPEVGMFAEGCRQFWRHAPHGISLCVELSYAQALKRILAHIRADGVFIDHLYMLQYAKFVRPLPVFYSATDVETNKFARWHTGDSLTTRRLLLHWAQSQVVRWYESHLGGKAAVTFATSEIDREFLRRLAGTGRFVVAPNGVDLDHFRPRSRQSFEGPPAVSFIGTMHYKPNRDAAAFLVRDVFPLIRRELPDATCHLAGKGDAHEFSGLMQHSSGIRAHGCVDDVRSFFINGQVLLVPLFVGSGTRIKILEAMASGTPVISTSVGAEGIEYSPDTNILIANTAHEIAALAVSLLRDPERAFTLGQAGRRLVEKRYSWDTSAEVVRSEIGRIFAQTQERSGIG